MEIEIKKSKRGNNYIEFEDTYEAECILKEDDDSIWLGKVDDKMNLDRERVKALLPYLQRFAETGSIIDS